MKTLKKHVLTVALLAALILTLTLGLVFLLPSRTAKADEEFTPDVTVQSARALREEVQNAYSSGDTPYKIQLGADIVLGEEGDSDTNGLFTFAKNLIIDLNGHTMKHQYGSWIFCVANIDAKLELIDTSEGKTGVITNDVPNSILIYNYGTLISSVNMTNKTNQAAIMSTPNGLKASDVDNPQVWAKKPSVTIKNGTFIGGSYWEFINLVDSNLTIENGTFLRETYSSSDRSIFKTETYSWESKEVNQERYWFADEHKPELRRQVKEKIGNILEAYAPYRGSEVLIKGGNFVGSQGRPENISLGSKISCNIPCGDEDEWGSHMGLLEMEETFESKVTIEGGYWSIDYSIYCPNNQWMRKYDPMGDPAGGPEGDYYIVDTIDEDIAVASVTAENINKSFSNFEAAWAYAKSVSGDRTVTVKQDATIEQMNLDIDLSTQAKDGTITLDLNGHKLTHTEYDKSAIVLNRMSALTLIIKDGSEDQTGELNFVLPSGNSPSTGRIDITNLNAKFVLESGTLRQTGYLPNEDTYKDPTANGNGSQARAASIFHIEPSVSYGRDDDQRALQIAALEALEEPVVTIKGGNILSEICFGTAEEHEGPTASKILVSWLDGHHYQSNFNFRQPENNNYTVSNKADKFQFDISAYIEAGHTSTFSWNFKDTESDDWKTLTAFNDLNCVADNGRYIFANVKEDDKYYVNGTGYDDITEAIEAAQPNGAITLLRDVTITEAIELDGITLDLDVNCHYTLTIGEGGSLTLKNNAVLCNGTVEGDITVEGNVTMRSATVTAEPFATVTVQNGTLTIPSGEYNCTFNVVGDAKIDITGGSFRGDQVTNLENYFSIPFYYAYNGTDGHYDNSTLYPVKIAPNPDAQEWYNRYKDSGKFEIASPDEWNYFAIYVSSGADSFEGKTVTLIDNLDFGYRPSVNGASAASESLLFLPAGTQGIPHYSYGFRGTFDGKGNTIKGINVTEINAGLFGRTDGKASISNITVADSVFTGGRGVGYFDEYNTEKGWVFAGGVIAQGYHGNNVDNPAKNITVQNVTIAQARNSGNIMAGGYIGQTWNDLCLEDINIDKVTLQGNWKMGGIVGFTEASVTIKNGSVTELDTSGCSGKYVGSVMGQLVGQSLTLDSCDVDAEDEYLIGGADAGSTDKKIEIKGVGTDIAAKGTTGSTDSAAHGSHTLAPTVTVPTTEEESTQEGGFSLDFKEEEIPNDAYKTEDGKTVVAFRLENDNMGGYTTLAAALEGAKNGDTVVLNMEVDESVTIDDGKELTLNLYGYTLTGTITVVGTLTLENGTVTGSIVNNGTLTLRMGENGLVIEYTADVITGNEYSVDEAACVRKQLSGDAVTRLELATSHGEKEYTAEGGTITLTCTICEKALGTVTLVAPEDLTFSGEKLEATVVVSPDGLIAETPAITYTDEAGEEVGEIINVGRYTASITLGGVKASVKFEVKQQQLVISEIQDEIAYQGDQALTLPITNYTLKDLAGNEVELDGITVTVTLQKSKYNVGTYVALITAISMTGNENYTLAVVGNQAFITITVNPTTLTVRVNGNGEVEYEGFVGGEDESVLGGTLTLEKVDNGDGTYTVTPSGFESENYNIVYVSGIVSAPAGTGASTPDYTLWIILGTLAAVALVCGTVAIVLIRRKRD